MFLVRDYRLREKVFAQAFLSKRLHLLRGHSAQVSR